MSTTRRTILAGSFALLAAPLGVRAQQTGKVTKIGFLRSGQPPETWVSALRQGLRDRDPDSKTVLEIKVTDTSPEHLAELAGELVRLNVDVIVAAGTPATVAAKSVTRTVPIVFVAVNDPVGSGLVRELSRPSGNITGLTNQTPDLLMKRVQLLKEVIPDLTRLAMLGNPAHPAYASQMKTLEAGMRSLGGRVEAIGVRDPKDFEDGFTVARNSQALLQLDDVLLTTHRARLIQLAAQMRLPVIYGFRDFVDAGGLMASGVNVPDLYRRAADYIDRIVKGAKPADLPVEQPTKFEFVINLKTARALGLTIPPSLLLWADQVID